MYKDPARLEGNVYLVSLMDCSGCDQQTDYVFMIDYVDTPMFTLHTVSMCLVCRTPLERVWDIDEFLSCFWITPLSTGN